VAAGTATESRSPSRRTGSAGRLRRGGALGVAAAAAVAIVALVGGGGGSAGARPKGPHARAVQRYLAQVEPIRRGVDRLLEGADPILTRYRRHRLGARETERRMHSLEGRFAAYRDEIERLHPVPAELSAAHRGYAHAYVLEDAYLGALAAAVPTRGFDSLPRTEGAQRAAIVAWRRRLQTVAGRLGVGLPADVQIAGRGEIAPSPRGG
jgi:hypothetical protein